jgi:putative transposase
LSLSARITRDILKSWSTWCNKEKRQLPIPKYKKKSMKLENCLCFLADNFVILVIEPRKKLYIPFKPHKHFNRLKTKKHGEISLKLNTNRTVDIFIPFIREIEEKPPKSILGIDTNERSIDMLLVTKDRVEFMSSDISELSTTHYTYSLKQKQIVKKITNGLKYQSNTKRRLLRKYGKREQNKIKDILHNLTNQIVDLAKKNESAVILEDLTGIRKSVTRKKSLKSGLGRRSKRIRRRLNRWNFRQFHTYLEYKINRTGYLVSYQNPSYTSITCLKYGKIANSTSHTFVCRFCGFKINHHFQATVNIVHRFLKNQDVASSDSAERYQMKMMARELRKFKDSLIGDTSQYNNIDDLYSFLTT